ncbi:MAG: hypothetical protein A3B66_07430 [Alphaproteobacteria bacterium RIFCSPHIGHO2_02_FULL_46_13]|nr:MAG: hypothetical protein A3B66_07430 [Alphaproteobacteria bacterium RIFCSPHIGHO2_02_FULL_46_13]
MNILYDTMNDWANSSCGAILEYYAAISAKDRNSLKRSVFGASRIFGEPCSVTFPSLIKIIWSAACLANPKWWVIRKTGDL